MFKFDLDIPTYAEWKTQLEKMTKDQPEQAKKISGANSEILERFLRRCVVSV